VLRPPLIFSHTHSSCALWMVRVVCLLCAYCVLRVRECLVLECVSLACPLPRPPVTGGEYRT